MQRGTSRLNSTWLHANERRTAMRASVLLFLAIVTAFGPVPSVFADIMYHFKAGLDGQTLGSVQFAQVAPEVGPQDFKVRLAGSVVGSAPSPDVSTARAYLDRW